MRSLTGVERGLFYSHVGWIFYKQKYPELRQVDKRDLEEDRIVAFQHKYFISLAVVFGLFLPALEGYIMGDTMSGILWGAFVSRVGIWHCTFLINSLAHWIGEQPFSIDNTSRGNFVLAFFTNGEFGFFRLNAKCLRRRMA